MSGCYLSWLCTLLITHTGFVSGDIRFIERLEGESVVLPCAVEQRSRPPFGVYLKRSWLRPGDVLFKYTGDDFHAEDQADKERTSVAGDPSLHRLNVTISRLRVSDTDRYSCEFIVSNPSSEDEHVRGPTEYFLHVSAGAQCGCSGYSSLLYALSSAVAVLLLLLFIGCVLLYKGKARRSDKTHPQAPIYEEMVGVQQPGRKQASRHLEETESSEYRNCPVKKSSHENHYESPSGGLK